MLKTSKFLKIYQPSNPAYYQTTICLPKINKVFLSPILQNLNGIVRFGQFLFGNYFLGRAEKDAIKEKVLSFKDDGQKRKMVVKIEFTSLPDCNKLPPL